MFGKGIDLTNTQIVEVNWRSVSVGSQKIFEQEHKTSSYTSKNCLNKEN